VIIFSTAARHRGGLRRAAPMTLNALVEIEAMLAPLRFRYFRLKAHFHFGLHLDGMAALYRRAETNR
jgi:hypothetical protein